MTDLERLKSLEDRTRKLELQAAVDEVHRDNVEGRLGGIEDTLKWLVRLVIGALLMTAVGYAISGGFAVV